MIEITSYKKCEVDSDTVTDFTLDIPGENFDFSKSPFGFMGWIVGKNFQFDNIEVFSSDRLVQSIPINIKRPDVAKLFTGNPGGDQVGFSSYFNPFLLPPRFELEVFGVAGGTRRVKLYHLSGRRAVFHSGFESTIRPLVLTTLGRTGSSVSIAMLGAHPEIAVYRPYQVEARYASYWVQMFLGLSDPKSWIYPISADERSDPGWILGDSITGPLHFSLYSEIFDWFNREYVESLFGFCMESIQRHYQKVAEIMKKNNTAFFCEKFLPDDFTDRFLDLIPESREIFLVRDFRDMFCSITAFNQKRGFYGFGRDKFQNDEDYITQRVKAGVNMLVESWNKRRDSAFLLKYEDIILRTEPTLKALFKYLGVDASISTIKQVIEKAKNMHPESQHLHQTNIDPTKSIGRFKRELSPDILRLCNESFKVGLEGFGYEV